MSIFKDTKFDISIAMQFITIIFSCGAIYATMSVKSDLQEDIANTRTEFKQDIGEVKQEIGYLKGRIDSLGRGRN
jgi:hypothetical protein